MAMASTGAAAAVVCLPSPSSTSWECQSSRAQSAPSLVRNHLAAATFAAPSSSVKAGCSSSSGGVSRESWGAISAINRLGGGVGSSRPRNREWRWQAVAEQLQAAETEATAEEGGFSPDAIFIFFEAQGSLPEASVAKLTSALEAVEGVSDVDVTASSDSTATVKLTKRMNVQATEVASGLVDVLLKGGFKLQALNLGFDEEDGDDDDFYEYDIASSIESDVAEQI